MKIKNLDINRVADLGSLGYLSWSKKARWQRLRLRLCFWFLGIVLPKPDTRVEIKTG